MNIIKYPNPILRNQSVKITEINDEIKKLAEDMKKTLLETKGIGLAAPQVGINKRLIVLRMFDNPNDMEVFINPEIVEQSKEKVDSLEEGCLSVPFIREAVKRSAKVKVEATRLDGSKVVCEWDGMKSTCIQHEIDHLDGMLFIDRVSTALKGKVKSQLKRLGMI